MRQSVLRLSLAGVILGLLVSSGIADTQSTDRIVALRSKITVARDRTLTVTENFEIDNAAAILDGGFLRRLPIKTTGPYRAKAGTIESVSARVDGVDNPIQKSQTNDAFEIRVVPQASGWSPGVHTIELHYVARHQFAIFDASEDLNLNISGEWPIPIEKAEVELLLPSGMPGDSGISADTGTDANFKFDCIRTDLPWGVKFETTHAIGPGARLFLSASFPRGGYFVSDVQRDGFSAVSENHPFLVPWLDFLGGFIASIAIGFAAVLLLARPVGSQLLPLSEHRLAMAVSIVATILSGASLFLFHEAYSAMPGFGLGALTSVIISGNPHGGEPFSLFIVGALSNLAFYYLAARGIRLVWLRVVGRVV
jgi:hypothetical protein